MSFVPYLYKWSRPSEKRDTRGEQNDRSPPRARNECDATVRSVRATRALRHRLPWNGSVVTIVLDCSLGLHSASDRVVPSDWERTFLSAKCLRVHDRFVAVRTWSDLVRLDAGRASHHGLNIAESRRLKMRNTVGEAGGAMGIECWRRRPRPFN